MKARHLAAVDPRLVAQLAWVFERDAAALARESRVFENESRMAMNHTLAELDKETKRIAETRRLRGIACELEAAAMNAGYVGYPFGEEVL